MSESPAAPPAAIRLRGLRVTLGGQEILRGVDLEAPARTSLAVVGESGSGKSMTAKALAGLLPQGAQVAGAYRLDGQDVDLAAGERTWRTIRGRRVVWLPQDPFTSLNPLRRCGPQVGAAAPGRLTRSERRALARAALEDVGLDADLYSAFPHELSGGMRQRVAIAAALAPRPQVLIADEPTTALDAQTQGEVLDLLERLRAEHRTTLILITHDLALARRRAEHLAVFQRGRVVEFGRTKELVANPRAAHTRQLLAAVAGVDDAARQLRVGPPAVSGGDVPTRSATPGASAGREAPHSSDASAGRDAPHSSGAATAPDPSGRFAATEFPQARDQLSQSIGGDGPASFGDVVCAKGLAKTYPGASEPALRDASIRVGAGEIVGVVGESGSGKTTLARLLVGLEQADAGTVVYRDGIGQEVRWRAGMAQLVFQNPYASLNPTMTARATVAEALRAVGDDPARAEATLRLAGFDPALADRKPRQLSGGERQRVAIARALAPSPRLLIADEAVSALDAAIQAQLLDTLEELRDRLGMAILFISHDLAAVARLAERVYVVYHGRIVEEGAAAQVLRAPAHPYTRLLVETMTAGGHEGSSN
ncbi:MAG: ABC transporter ATP-binding protein [Bifidobacteriaceae bacterium]|jgi:peptide/nickel transport system ATP-binding protein|nr:ABC transporter ATP-binding protein [Bifidobacteriaceae bacterium]